MENIFLMFLSIWIYYRYLDKDMELQKIALGVIRSFVNLSFIIVIKSNEM